MATTWIKPLHAGSQRSVKQTLHRIINYGMNPDKTDQGRLVTCHDCDRETVVAEFLLAKRQYIAITGRKQSKKNDVLLYHVEQSFPANEVTAEQAHAIGQELAQKLSKRNFAFIVNTHIDKAHFHNHIYIHAIALNYSYKFDNFKGSAWAVRRISDHICLEHGLSIVEDPKPSKGLKEKWKNEKTIRNQEKLCWAIDDALAKSPSDFDDFIRLMEADGYKAKRGKHLLFYVPGSKKGTRCDTLRGDYTDDAIRERIAGIRTVIPYPRREMPKEKNSDIKFFIDIQAKIQSGKGAYYERWAKVFNLKQAAATLLYLQENKLNSYDLLESKTAQSNNQLSQYDRDIRRLESQMTDNAQLQKHIVNYIKTRDIYTDYRKAGYSKKYLATHEKDILLHKEAKNVFEKIGGKIPKVADLRKEYAELLKQKNLLYGQKKSCKNETQELLTAKANVDLLLGKQSVQEKLETAKERVDNKTKIFDKKEPDR